MNSDQRLTWLAIAMAVLVAAYVLYALRVIFH